MNRILKDFVGKGLPAIGAAAFFVATPAIFVAAPAEAAETSAAELQQAVAALRGIQTMRADFVQTDRAGRRVSGVFMLKRPGRIRFQYEKGVPLLIVGDGKALTFVDRQVRQFQRWPIGNSPLGALLQPGRDMSRYGRIVPAPAAGLVAVEVRDPGHPEYGTMTLYLERKAAAPAGLELVGWSTVDSQNQRTSVRLSGHVYGIALDDSQFRVLDTSVRPHK